jgi:zinc transport system substrate-binding protein
MMRAPGRLLLSPALLQSVLLPALLLWLAVPAAAQTPGRIKVFVSVLPQAYLVGRVGGERITVETLVQPGQSPVTYAPTPKQMVRLAEADLFFRAGVPFENVLMPKIEATFQNLRVVDTRRGIPLLMPDPEDDHIGAGEEDPHVWLSPPLALRLAENMLSGLLRADPAGESFYRANFARLETELNTLHRKLTEALAPVRGKKLFVFHPAFGYFCSAYGLEQVAIESGGREPSPRQLARLIETARREGVRVIFVQPQFSSQSAASVARAIGGAVIAIDPLAEDYIGNLYELAETIKTALIGG